MEDRLARYLDGDLDEAQAVALLRGTREDPDLERELRDYEALLQAAGDLPVLKAPAGLADDVMTAVDSEAGRDRTGAWSWPGRSGWLAAAAALAVGVLLGALARSPGWQGSSGRPEAALTADSSVSGPGSAVSGSEPSVAPVALATPVDGGDAPLTAYRLVRLTYPAAGPEVRSVTVAGTFNGWDRTALPMSRGPEGWSLLLLLPPGQHEYMFVVNGERWVTDPGASRTRDDGFGGANGVLEVRT